MSNPSHYLKTILFSTAAAALLTACAGTGYKSETPPAQENTAQTPVEEQEAVEDTTPPADVLFAEKYEYKYGDMEIGAALYGEEQSFSLNLTYTARDEGAYETAVAFNSIYNGCVSLKEMADLGIAVLDGNKYFIVAIDADGEQRMYTGDTGLMEGTPDWMPEIKTEELPEEFAEYYLAIVKDIKDFSEKYQQMIIEAQEKYNSN